MIAALFAAPLIPIFLMRIDLPRLNLYDRAQSYVVHPLSELVTNAFQGVGHIWSRYLYLVDTQRNNEALKQEIAGLKNEILGFEEVRIENERLRQLTSLPEFPKFDGVTARIIGQDLSSESLGFLINAGEAQGLKPRMPVITADGVVGTIERVFAHSALFTSVQDPAHDVDGLSVRTRARMIVEGKGKPLVARLKYLDRAEDVRVGDEILTSGLDGVFPKGLRIGLIVKVDRPRTGILQEALLRPSVDLGRLEEVVVLRRSEEALGAAAR